MDSDTSSYVVEEMFGSNGSDVYHEDNQSDTFKRQQLFKDCIDKLSDEV
jgi:hypothetical protein